ncbi:MAG TPA: response regulator, partial [Flavipsychrobacter sp.]|nr:response regulator [Flavipsychrobacter sp.]
MKKILLIEDNLEIRENMAEIMELAGYSVLTAADGKEGISAALHHRPDLIICDIMMPVLDGYGVIHTLQKNKDTQNIPFIFLTAKAERAEMRRGMELGADDYITKPFSGAELLSAVETRLRRVDSLKEELAGNLDKVTDLLSKVSSKEALEDFTKDRVIAKFKKKQIIYSEGNRPHRMYFVHKGKIKAY